jgi:pentatricopeptide repeat protein
MPERDVVSWTAIIAGYTQSGNYDEAMQFFREMQLVRVKINSDTFTSILPACANLGALNLGREVHANIIRSGFQFNLFVGSALLDMYAKCGIIEEAQKVFAQMPERSLVSWNTVIAGYVQNGHVDEALELFKKMDTRNVISWTAMIAGYAQDGQYDKALKFFGQMQLTGVKPDSDVFSCVLPACANLATLHAGKEVHEDIIRGGFHSNVFVENSLIDMYAKCGSIEDACRVFDKMPTRDVVSWTAMIVGYATHGYGKEALELFQQMQQSGTKPDHATFLGVLSACCHAGLVAEGQQYFDSMSHAYHISPGLEHYSCMVDILGRAGLLNEAVEFIHKMPIKPNAAVWGSLLGACITHMNIELGEYVAEHVLKLEPENAAHYVVLSNIYSAAGRWSDVEKVRKMMKERRIKRRPGCSWVEVNNEVHAFVIGASSKPERHNLFIVT